MVLLFGKISVVFLKWWLGVKVCFSFNWFGVGFNIWDWMGIYSYCIGNWLLFSIKYVMSMLWW